jgi:tRNA-intron endonuclease
MRREYAKGSFEDDHVIVPDEADASRLRSRGRFGTTIDGGALRLDLVESLYLVEEGRLRLRAGHSELLHAGYGQHPDFGVRLLAYADLRSRGLSLSSSRSVTSFDMFPRGSEPGEASDSAIMVASERSTLSMDAVLTLASEVLPERDLLYSIVDDEGDVTHYSVSIPDSAGDWDAVIPEGGITILEDRGIVEGPAASELFDSGFFGRRMGGRTIVSLVESAYLGERGMELSRGSRRTTPRAVIRRASKLDGSAQIKHQAYAELRNRGLIPKTGFKFGGHFRVYDSMPRTKRESDRTHARILMQIVPRHFKTTWADVSRAVRLAHGVRKEMIYFAPPSRFLRIERVRP